jgi:tripeptidyl-peptidase-1
MGHNHVACESYSIPHHLTEHIDIVTPTVHFDTRIGSPRKNHATQRPTSSNLGIEQEMAAVKRDLAENQLHGLLGSELDASNPKQGAEVKNALMTLANCDTMITPACLQALYNAPPNTLSMKNNSLGVVEYTPQAFIQVDLNMYFKQFSPSQDGVSPDTHLIDGAVIQTKNQSFNFNGESAWIWSLLCPSSSHNR